MKQKIKENKYILISFILSICILIIVSIFQGHYPFGSNSLLESDLSSQYTPFLNELIERIYTGKSLIYSFSISGGIPFFRTILNYLSSPLNILLLLFRNNIIIGVTLLIYLKISLSSLTMSYYLKNSIKNDKSIILFSLLYSFSGYVAAYYFNIMWLDGFFMLPIIMFGINKLVKDKKPYLYIFSLTLTLLSNYYIGYMICIASVLYFLAYFYLIEEKTKKNILKTFSLFAFSSLVAGTLVFFALMPMAITLKDMAASDLELPNKIFYFNPLNFLFGHLQGSRISIKIKQALPLPNISCGILSMLMIILLFINKKIDKKYKKICLITILFFFFSFSFTYFDLIWNVFHLPNDFPWRYSFIYSFFLLIFAYISYLKLKNITKKEFNKSIIILSIIALLALITSYENLKIDKIVIIFLLIIIYYILFNYKIEKHKQFIFLSLIVIFECIFNINTNWIFTYEYKSNKNNLEYYKEVLNEIDDINEYNIEEYLNVAKNIGSWTNTKSISGFSSTNYSSVSLFHYKLGASSNKETAHRLSYVNTPIYNTVFNIKYHILKRDDFNKNYYEIYKKLNDSIIYENKYNTSLMYAVDKNIKALNLSSEDPFINQENLIKSLTNENINVYEKLKVKQIISNDEVIEYEITTNKKDTYIYAGNAKSWTLTESSNINKKKNYYNDLESDIVNIGKTKEDKIKVTINKKELTSNLNLVAYTINEKEFKKIYDSISKELVTITENKEDYIKGNISVSEDKTIFTTIPYDKSWKVFIDGKEIHTYSIDETYLAFDITKGKHNITLKYEIRGLKLGIIISIISFTSLIIYSIKKRSN